MTLEEAIALAREQYRANKHMDAFQTMLLVSPNMTLAEFAEVVRNRVGRAVVAAAIPKEGK